MKKININSIIRRWDDKVPICLNSVINQTYTNWMYIILVSDESRHHIEDFLATKLDDDFIEENFKLYDYEEFKDISIRWIMFAQSCDYIFNLDGDDYLEPDCLEKLVNAIEETGSDIACCGIAAHDVKNKIVETGYSVSNRIVYSRDDYSNSFEKYFIFYRTIWGKLYKSTLFTEDVLADIPQPTEYGSYGGDTMTALAVLAQTQRFVIAEGIGYNYMIWDGSVSYKFLPNREKADPLIHEHIVRFLLNYDETISLKNIMFLAVVHNNAIITVLELLLHCDLTSNEKFDKFHYIITNEISVSNIPLADKNKFHNISNLFSKFLTEIKSIDSMKTEKHYKQVCEILSVIWSSKAENIDICKKILTEVITFITDDYVDDISKILSKVSPNCHQVLTTATLDIFQKDVKLLNALVNDDSSIIITQLLKLTKKENAKQISFSSIKLLLPDDSLIQLIDEPEFLTRYKKIVDFLVNDELEGAFNLMTDSIMANKKIEFTEIYLNLYINISSRLGIELGYLVGRLKLAQLHYDNNDLEKSISIAKELLQAGLQSDELDELVSKLINE